MSKDWTDDSFLGYVELHSRTERALFHRVHVARLFKLAGKPEPAGLPEWMSVREDVAIPLVRSARCILVARRGAYGHLVNVPVA